MKLFDLGIKRSTGSGLPKIDYPGLYLDKVSDELMNKELGGLCRLEIVVKIESKSIDEREGKKTRSMRLEVQKMRFIGKAGKLNKEEYMDLNPPEREAYDSEQIYSK